MGETIFNPVSRLHLSAGDSAMFIGHTCGMPGRTRRACAAYCVLHRSQAAIFTHVYLVPTDGGPRGEVFLAAVFEGERRADALDWAAAHLPLVSAGDARQAA